MLATWNLLLLDCPLMASATMLVALNLELSCTLPLMPLFLAYAIANIMYNSPSSNIAKQVDYIVWKVIFLCLNIIFVNGIIWWNEITYVKNFQYPIQNEIEEAS